MRYKMIAGKYKVSCVGLGGHYAAWDNGPDDRLTYGAMDAEEIRKREGLVRRAVDAGINYFDSTWRNEADMLFSTIRPLNVREKLFISGMVLGAFNKTSFSGMSSVEYVEDALNYRLKRVPGNYLDCFQLQAPERGYSDALADDVMAYLEKRKQQGDILTVGISTHKPKEARKFIDRYDVDLVMQAYNYHHHEADEIFRDYRGPATFIAMKPLIWQISTYGIPFMNADWMPDFTPPANADEIASHSIAWSALSPSVSTVVCSVNSDRDLDGLIRASEILHPDVAALQQYEEAIRREGSIPFALSSLKNPAFNERNYLYAARSISRLMGVEFPFDKDATVPYKDLAFGMKEIKEYIEVLKEEAIKRGYGKYVL